MKLKVLQISTLDLSGGAAQIAYNLHGAYKNFGKLAWMAVGHKQSTDVDIFSIPKLAKRTLWFRTLSQINCLIEKYLSRFPGSSRVRDKLELYAKGEDYFPFIHGMENFCFPGSRHVLELTPEMPNLIHAHNLHGDYFDLSYLSSLSKRLPVVLTMHDAWLLSGNCAHSFECNRWKIGCGQCPDISINPGLQVDSTALNWKRKLNIYKNSFLYVATPCQWLMNKVNDSILSVGMIEGRVIPNGVSLEDFFPLEKKAARKILGLPIDEFILLFAANGIRNNIFKDFNTLHHALRSLSEKIITPIKVIALGEEGQSEFFGNITVVYIPHTHDKKIVSTYYQAADIYLHPARAETFPNTILEAMACGTPVVATNIGGIPEQVVDGETGILVPPGRPEEFAFAILNLLENQSAMHDMGSKSYLRIQQKFSLDRQARNYISWFEEIIEKFPRS